MAYTTINKSTDNFNTKIIRSNLNNTENTASDYVQSFDSDGFTLGTNGNANSNGDTFCSWNWKAGGSTSSNSDGNINSTVSVNTTAGFSIVSYTGNGYTNQTVGHGLGVKPAVIILKNRDDTNNWVMYHQKLNNGTNPEVKYLELNSTNGQLDDASIFNDTAPTSSVFTIGSASDTGGGSGGNNEKIIAYCFAEKTGYSKFGSYVGNGNADGTFVYTGFKPSFVMIKEISSNGYQWTIVDDKRSSSNSSSMKWLFPDSNGVETTESTWDLLSNGFKQRANHSYVNHSGTHIYMAFGQSLVGSNNIPCTAR